MSRVLGAKIHLSAILTGALVTGCGTEVSEDAPRTWDGPFLIDKVVIDCDTRAWTYDVRTQGWGEEITVQVVARELGQLIWQERHVLAEVDHGDDWARFAITLDQATSADEVETGGSTLFLCEAKTLLTYGIAAWGYDGELSECIGWGIDPEGEFPDCASWGQVDH